MSDFKTASSRKWGTVYSVVTFKFVETLVYCNLYSLGVRLRSVGRRMTRYGSAPRINPPFADGWLQRTPQFTPSIGDIADLNISRPPATVGLIHAKDLQGT